MRIVVVGATGWLGGAVVKALAVQPGTTVVAAARTPSRVDRLGAPGVITVEADLERARTLRNAVRGADLVINCAAETRERAKLEEYRRSHATGTRMLLESMLGEHVSSYLHLSSALVYGFDLPPRPVDETQPTHPLHPLSVALLEREQAVHEIAEAHGLHAVVLRPAITLGPRDNLSLHTLAWGHARGLVPLIDGGRARFSAIDVRDVGEAVAFLAAHWNRAEGTYHAAGFQTSWREVITALDRATGHRALVLPVSHGTAMGLARLGERWVPAPRVPPLTDFRVGVLGVRLLLDDRRLRDLGWWPRRTLQDAVDGYVRPPPGA